ncbi:hypothetical protein [Streptomyces hawaiiensis]|uniref:hypothetical protein n=1 Tax=Streptomyces hawaiiensis TaxID=67305 RepID=UPI00364E0018
MQHTTSERKGSSATLPRNSHSQQMGGQVGAKSLFHDRVTARPVLSGSPCLCSQRHTASLITTVAATGKTGTSSTVSDTPA